jgi:hypothetical protein
MFLPLGKDAGEGVDREDWQTDQHRERDEQHRGKREERTSLGRPNWDEGTDNPTEAKNAAPD